MTEEDAEQLHETIADVIIRYHSYSQYGSRVKAVAALCRRTGEDVAACEELFDFYSALFAATKRIMKTARLSHICPSPDTESEIQSAWREVADQLTQEFDDAPDDAQLPMFINWIHFWYHLK